MKIQPIYKSKKYKASIPTPPKKLIGYLHTAQEEKNYATEVANYKRIMASFPEDGLIWCEQSNFCDLLKWRIKNELYVPKIAKIFLSSTPMFTHLDDEAHSIAMNKFMDKLVNNSGVYIGPNSPKDDTECTPQYATQWLSTSPWATEVDKAEWALYHGDKMAAISSIAAAEKAAADAVKKQIKRKERNKYIREYMLAGAGKDSPANILADAKTYSEIMLTMEL